MYLLWSIEAANYVTWHLVIFDLMGLYTFQLGPITNISHYIYVGSMGLYLSPIIWCHNFMTACMKSPARTCSSNLETGYNELESQPFYALTWELIGPSYFLIWVSYIIKRNISISMSCIMPPMFPIIIPSSTTTQSSVIYKKLYFL